MTPKKGLTAQLQSALFDRRRNADRRVLDEGPPPGMVERRIQAERRGLEVEEIKDLVIDDHQPTESNDTSQRASEQ